MDEDEEEEDAQDAATRRHLQRLDDGLFTLRLIDYLLAEVFSQCGVQVRCMRRVGASQGRGGLASSRALW